MSTLRTALPLASLTAVGMLATDLYLPAVPSLPEHIGGTLEASQMTLASFTAALALSQLVWGWASDRYGEERVLKIGTLILFLSSVLCALVPSMDLLIFARALQGLGAGAATAAVPSLLRRSFKETEAVRAISFVGMAESVVPALGPVIGALLISVTGWRASFWVLTLLTAALLPFVARLTGRVARSNEPHEPVLASLGALVSNGVFIRYALAYAIMFGALVLFVFSAPQIVSKSLGLPVQFFSVMQVLGVSSFIAAASQGGRLVAKVGIPRVLRAGALFQIAAGFALCALGLSAAPPFYAIVVGWCLFTVGLGIRGPSLMAKSLESAGPRSGQASGLLMFLAFGATACGTAAVAPFLSLGIIAPAVALLALSLLSAILTSAKSNKTGSFA